MTELDEIRRRLKALEGDIMGKDDLKDLMSETVLDTLTKIGIDAENPLRMQQDFQTLHSWSETMSKVKGKVLLTVVGLAVTGCVGALILGVKLYLSST